MLISFEVANFCSFRDNAVFSMEATREKQHRQQHIYEAKTDSGECDLLRASLMYGQNASGKSNFIKALEFAKKFVTRGVRPKKAIGSTTFKLDKEYRTRPSRFYFKLLIEENIYSYEFILSHDSIVMEELREVTKTSSKLLFNRKINDDGDIQHKFGSVINKLPKEDQQYYDFTIEATRPNQLFLTESVERNATLFQPIYDWFDKSLRIFTPNSISHGVEFRIGDDKEFQKFLKNILFQFDPSVTGIKADIVGIESAIGLHARVLSDIDDKIDENGAVFISNMATGGRSVVLKNEDGELGLLKIFTQHKCINSDEKITFELEEESDGTRRLIELAPLFYELMTSDKCVVAFIDELDRSLHPALTKQLVELFLNTSTKQKSQMVVSTHDINLLDTSLLRRDSIWFILKEDGVSKLVSLYKKFNPRHDKDIRKEYIEGIYDAHKSFS